MASSRPLPLRISAFPLASHRRVCSRLASSLLLSIHIIASPLASHHRISSRFASSLLLSLTPSRLLSIRIIAWHHRFSPRFAPSRLLSLEETGLSLLLSDTEEVGAGAVLGSSLRRRWHLHAPHCQHRVLDGPALGGKGSKGRNWLDCIRGKRRKGPDLPEGMVSVNHPGPGPHAHHPQPSALECRGDNLKGREDFVKKAKTRI